MPTHGSTEMCELGGEGERRQGEAWRSMVQRGVAKHDEMRRGGEAKRGVPRQRRGEAKRGVPRQGEARQSAESRGKARRGKARSPEARRGEAKRGVPRQGEARCDAAEQVLFGECDKTIC
jgi:hypothetical protein